jgi:hypothetical protein
MLVRARKLCDQYGNSFYRRVYIAGVAYTFPGIRDFYYTIVTFLRGPCDNPIIGAVIAHVSVTEESETPTLVYHRGNSKHGIFEFFDDKVEDYTIKVPYDQVSY